MAKVIQFLSLLLYSYIKILAFFVLNLCWGLHKSMFFKFSNINVGNLVANTYSWMKDKMRRRLQQLFLLVIVSATIAELPICPLNVQYFPQSLPMHCRMPPGVAVAGAANANGNGSPAPPADDKGNGNGNENGNGNPVQSDYNSPPPNMMPQPYPFPIPPGIPGPIFPPAPFPVIPGPPPPQKLPVIVMPFYSPDPAFKKGKEKHDDHDKNHGHSDRSGRNRDRDRRRPRPHKKRYKSSSDTGTDSDCDTSSDTSDTDTDSSSSDFDDFRRDMKRTKKHRHNKDKNNFKIRRHRHHNHRRMMRPPPPEQHELLTPLIQYVTKDGYVIYEKEISKNEAKDWLNVAKVEDQTKISFQELDDLNKEIPGDGTGDAVETLSATDLEKSKMELEREIKKVEQEIMEEQNSQNAEPKTLKPKLKKWKKKGPMTRKEKFAEKIGVDVEALS